MTFDQIQRLIFFNTKTNENSLTDANLNLLVGVALDRVVSLIMRADSNWQYDDSNHPDLPSATTTITANQQDYSLATTHLTIDRVELKDSSSNWHLLTQIDRKDIQQEPLAQAESTRSGAFLSGTGRPRVYDLVGNILFLYPVPNFTQASSLKVYFTRGALKFDYTDDKFTDDTGSASSEPGFNSLFHELIPLWVSYNYWITNKPSKAVGFFNEIQNKEALLDEFYGNRLRDKKPTFSISTNQQVRAESGRLGVTGGDSNR